MRNIVEVRGLSFKYEDTESPVLNDINLTVKEGEFLGIMGPTGAGKTTLCLCISGLIPHTLSGEFKGDVTIAGMKTTEHTLHEFAPKMIGMVFQDPESQLFGLDVEEDVTFALEYLGLSREEMKNRLRWALNIVRLDGFEERFPYYLSGGQKQRVAIASVLASRPKILILDEPTSELDPVGRGEVFRAIDEIRRIYKCTTIVVEHNAEELVKFADKLIIMNDGRIVLEGTPDDVFQRGAELHTLGIKPPQVTELGCLLRDHEVDEWIEYDIPLTIEEAYDRLVRIFRKRNIMSKQYGIEKPSSNAQEEEPIIQVKDLWHIYGRGTDREMAALKGIDLTVYPNEFIAFIGQNGSGKTTLAKHFNGLLKPSKGHVIVNGKDTRRCSISELAETIGYCFQNPDHQIFNRTVYDEVAYGPKNLGLSKEEVQERVIEAIKAVGLEGYEKLNPLFLGKGERQKVAVASVLAMHPRLLIVDEPTTGMDWKTSITMMNLIKQLNQNGMAVVFITHNMEIVAEYARRVVVLFEGKAILDGPTNWVFSQPDVLMKTLIKPPQITQLAQMLKGYFKPDTISVREAYEHLC